MITNIPPLVMLAVFSGLGMNLILQLGLALKGTVFDSIIDREKHLAGMGVLFTSIILLWLVFFVIRSVVFLGFLEYMLLFPAGYLVYSGLAYLTNRFILKKDPGQEEVFFPHNALSGGALIGASLFITLNIADGLLETIVLSLGFSASAALVYVVVGEIRRRSEIEAVPRWLRGGPLALIAMGLLSLIFCSGAMMLFGVLKAR